MHLELGEFIRSQGDYLCLVLGTVVSLAVLSQCLKRRTLAEQQLRRTLHQMPLGCIEWDVNSKVVQWNPAAERIFGHTAEEALGKSIFSLVVPPSARDRTDGIWPDLLEGRGGSHGIQDNITRDGRPIACEWFSTPIIGGSGEVVAVMSLVQDVAGRVRIKKPPRQSDRLNAVGDLTAGVAHDFNNILTVIAGHTGVSLGETALPEDQQFQMNRIKEVASRAGGLTRQLLACNQQQAHYPKPVAMADVIDSCSAMLSRWLGEDVPLNLQVAAGVSPVEADPALMQQVITNLVLNARDALDGPGHITVRLDSAVISHETASRNAEARQGPVVCLSVSDTGNGIASEHLSRVFEPFFSTKPVGQGIGLGLSVVHGIVQQHGGWITVDTKPGAGTTFSIFLPPCPGPAAPPESDPSLADRSGALGTILLAEDEELVRELARLTLEQAGFRVFEAADGLQALRIWREHRNEIDLLFTDMVMPNGLTGRQLSAELQAERPELPVIYASGYSLDVIAPDFEAGEQVVFLPKPYLTDQLLDATQQCLRAGAPA